MRPFLYFLMLVPAFFVAIPAQDQAEQPKKINIAVINLRAEGSLASASGILSDRLRAECFNTGKFAVMERGEMDAVLKEQGFQATGACDDQACMIEMGQLLGVEKIVAGSIGLLGAVYLINLRIIDVKTGKLEHTYSGECRCPVEDLGGAMKTAAEELAAGRAKEEKPEAPKAVKAEAPKPKKPKKPAAPGDFRNRKGIGLSGAFRSVDPEFNDIVPGLELFNITKKDGDLAFNAMNEFDLHFLWPLGRFFSIKAGGGVSRSTTEGTLTATLDTSLAPISIDVLAEAALTNIPLRIGVMVHSKPGKFRAHLGFDLLPVFSGFTLDFAPDLPAVWAILGDTLESWLDLRSFTVGTETSLGCEYLFSPRFGISADFIFTRCVFQEYSGSGKIGLLNLGEEEQTYHFVDVDDDLGTYVTFMTDNEIQAKTDQGYHVAKTGVGVTGAGIKLTMRIYF